MRLAECFVLRGVAVHEGGHVVGVRLPVEDQLRLTHELTDPGADHVDSDDGSFLLPHQLDEPLCLEDLALAVAAEVVGQRLDLVLAVLLLGRALVETHRGDLGLAVGHPRNPGLVDGRGVQTGDVFSDEDALLESSVRQLQAGNDVADGVHVLEVGLATLVSEDETAIHVDALLVVTETVRRGTAADCDQQDLGVDRVTSLDSHPDTAIGGLHALERCSHLEGDLALAHRALERLGDILVLGSHQPGQSLDDGHVGAEGLPYGRELGADDAAAEHDHRLRHTVEQERMVGGQDRLAVDLKTGQGLGVGTRGEHDLLADVPLTVNLDRVRRDELALALDDVDTAGLDQSAEAFVQPRDHAVLVLVDTDHVDALERGVDAELLRLTGRVRYLGRVQERLGGNATHMQAGATQLSLLDQRHREAELRGTKGTGVATAARTQDEYVEVVVALCVAGVRHRASGPVELPRVRPSGDIIPPSAVLSTPALKSRSGPCASWCRRGSPYLLAT